MTVHYGYERHENGASSLTLSHELRQRASERSSTYVPISGLSKPTWSDFPSPVLPPRTKTFCGILHYLNDGAVRGVERRIFVVQPRHEFFGVLRWQAVFDDFDVVAWTVVDLLFRVRSRFSHVI